MTIQTELFGIEEVSLEVPSTIAEIISLGVDEARVVELAIAGAMNSNANKIKAAFVSAVEAATNEKRKEDEKGKKTESLAGYVARMKDAFPDFESKFRPLLEKACAEHKFSFIRERSAVAEVRVPTRFVTRVKLMFDKGVLEGALAKYAPSFDYNSLLDGQALTDEGALEAAKILRAPLEQKEKEVLEANLAI